MNAIRETRRFLFQLLAIVFFGVVSSGSAATFDIADGDVAGLIDAIDQCNHNSQDNTINLASNSAYVLTVATESDLAVGASGLVIHGGYHDGHVYDLTINGNNSSITRSTAANTPAFRVLAIRPLSSTELTAHFTINNVTIANGSAVPAFSPIGIPIEYAGYGAGLFSDGYATLNNCTIRDNHAYRGGGLHATLHVVLNNCTIMQNTASQDGGGIYTQSQAFAGTLVDHDSSVELSNCTLASNQASEGNGAGIYHRGYDSNYPSILNLDGCTLAWNEVFIDGSPSGAIFTFTNTLFASAAVTNRDLTHPTIISNGYNLTDATTQGYFTQATDRWNADPKLDREGLQFNGGPTPTIALYAGSDAIDHGNSGPFDFFDQRGSPRKVDNPSVPNTADGTDIGAYEAPVDPVQSGFPYVVTTLTDHDDGVCGGNDCTLREAIARVNSVTTNFQETISFGSGVTGISCSTATNWS